MKILMVCLGNICRSPLAEGVLRQKLDQKGIDWYVDSAGTSKKHVSEIPDERSLEVAEIHGIDLYNKRAREFTFEDFDEFDLIFAMDSSNEKNILSLAKNTTQKEKVKLIMNELVPGENIEIPDPYYGEFGFENVYLLLDAVCEKIIEKYEKCNAI